METIVQSDSESYNIKQLNKDLKKLVVKSPEQQIHLLSKLEKILETQTDVEDIAMIDKQLPKNLKKEPYVKYFNTTNEYNIEIMKVILLKRNHFDDYDYATLLSKIGYFEQTELFDLIVKKRPEFIEAHRSDPNNFVLIYTSNKGNVEFAKKILGAGVDPTIMNQCALSSATKNGDIEMVKLLIEEPDTDIFYEHEVLLEIAVDSGNHLMVDLYLNLGLKITDSAFCRACKLDLDKTVKVMLNHGATVPTKARKIANNLKNKNISKLLRAASKR